MNIRTFILIIILLKPFSMIYSQVLFSEKEKENLAFELSQIYGLDQGIRSLWRHLNTSDIITIDSLNFSRVINFIKEYGYPRVEILGDNYYTQESVQTTAFCVFVHYSKGLKDSELRELLRQEVIAGRLRKSEYKLILDKYYVDCERKSVLNTPYKAFLKSNALCIENKSISDSILQSIGEPPLPDSVFVNCK